MTDFKREDNTMYSIPQSFADEKLNCCPFCRKENPKWLVKEEWKLLGKNYHFKCPVCGCILMVSQDDVTGLSYTTKSFAGQMKKYKGKENRQIYVKIVKRGSGAKVQSNLLPEGQEISLQELNVLIKKEK